MRDKTKGSPRIATNSTDAIGSLITAPDNSIHPVARSLLPIKDNAIDSSDFSTMSSFLAPDCVFIYGNLPPFVSRGVIVDLFQNISGARKSARHYDYDYFVKGGREWMITCMFEQVLTTPAGIDKVVALQAAARFVENEEGLFTVYRGSTISRCGRFDSVVAYRSSPLARGIADVLMDPTPSAVATGKAVVPDKDYNPVVIEHTP